MSIVNLLVEGDIDEAVAGRLVSRHGGDVGTTFGKQGSGYIKEKLGGFARASAGIPLLVLADLADTGKACAPAAVSDWLPHCPPTTLFRLAVREIESWLVADRVGLADYLGVALAIVPDAPDKISDPKQLIVSLARRSRSRAIKEALTPSGAGATTGPLYNSRLVGFVRDRWDPSEAVAVSPSLQRADSALASFIATL